MDLHCYPQQQFTGSVRVQVQSNYCDDVGVVHWISAPLLRCIRRTCLCHCQLTHNNHYTALKCSMSSHPVYCTPQQLHTDSHPMICWPLFIVLWNQRTSSPACLHRLLRTITPGTSPCPANIFSRSFPLFLMEHSVPLRLFWGSAFAK